MFFHRAEKESINPCYVTLKAGYLFGGRYLRIAVRVDVLNGNGTFVSNLRGCCAETGCIWRDKTVYTS